MTVAQTQVNLYYLEKRVYPATIQELVNGGYLTDKQTKCSNNKVLVLDDNYNVQIQ